MNRKRHDQSSPGGKRIQPGPLPGPPGWTPSDPPRRGKDAIEEDIASMALRSAMTTMPDDAADETLGMLLALEVAKRHR